MAKLVDRESLKAFRQENDKRYAKPDGNYPTMTVGYADLSGNLDSKVMSNDVSAYLFRTAGGSLEIGEYCKVNSIIGGSLGFNQLVYDGGEEKTSEGNLTFSASPNNYKVVKGHRYLYSLTIKGNNGDIYKIRPAVSGNTQGFNFNITLTADYKTYSGIFSAGDNDINAIGNYFNCIWLSGVGTGDNYAKNVMLIDLTAMLGSTIADYIYSLETQTAGAGVAWFKRYFPKVYYPYTPIGSFVNVMTKGKKYVGFNQWDEVWELGDINTFTGQPQNSSTYIRSKNFNQCIPNTTYYGKSTTRIWLFWYDKDKNYIGVTTGGFLNTTKTSPSNAYFFKITCNVNTYNHDICINFHYDGERDGEYEPYKTHTVDLDTNWNSIGIPQIDENGNLYFIGNRYNYDGSVEEEWKIVDMGTLTFTSANENGACNTTSLLSLMEVNSANFWCAKGYNQYSSYSAYANGTEPKIGNTNDALYIRDSALANKTADQVKAYFSGIYLIYKKATATQSTAITPFPQVQKVDNWGTEQFLAPDNDTRVCEVPVGHDTDYPMDCKSKIEIAPDLPDDDGEYVCKVESGTASYVSLASYLQANGYVNQISADAIKENIGGALRHQLATANSLDFNNTAWLDLGDLNWGNPGTAYGVKEYNSSVVSGIKIPADNNTIANIICPLYKSNKRTAGAVNCIMVASDGSILITEQGNYTGAKFKNKVKGILLAYEKA